MSSETAVPPPVLWAQRKEDVLLTFSVESKDPTIKIEKDSVYFKGVNAQDNRLHEVTIPLYDAVVPENSGFVNKGRCIEMALKKEKKDAGYWPSLTKDKKKPHYLKVDFNKWKDEDDEEDNGGGNNYDISEMLRSISGAGDKQDKPSFDDLESDSDDENLPDLE
ncbi:LOW QUALITY PROTEIN: uncharacterized protein CG16817 [Manduca sexta]|uniref:CS domain-containing protein n=1 Tax=Manduca sexta TaxID=7130 RepID=A0A922CDH0_MANSE|nr:LOW QUALITY PROTEIN: uncharacterized protein CG16817 [Manduca sexta]KAG6441378.1 hypothetical protein O3G_MSEX001782 [Manduca sexta]